MKRKCVLLRVGVDSGSGCIQSPLFANGTFEFVCIPDRSGVGKQTYGNTVGRCRTPLIDYFPPSRRAAMMKTSIHIDPEFESLTYGDPTLPKRSLRRLNKCDLLVFYCGLQHWNVASGWIQSMRPGLYLAGYFEVALAGMACEFESKVLKREFGSNFHVRHRSLFDRQKRDLVLVKGGKGSRLFNRAYQISEEGRDKTGKPLKVLSSEMQKVFGTFDGKIAIQRSPPRWVADENIDKAIAFVKGLK